MEEQRRMRMSLELPPLAALVIRIEEEAAVDALQQDDARRGPPVRADGRQGHGRRLGQLGANGFFQPLAELTQRIGVDVLLVERGEMVLAAKVGDVQSQDEANGGDGKS